MEPIFWPALLLVVGLVLFAAELVLPSGGILGLAASACLIVGAYLAVTVPGAGGYGWLGFEAATIAATWGGMAFVLPRTRLGRRAYLRPPGDGELHDDDRRDAALGQLGRTGRALTPLRPSGMIDLGGRRVEAMAESGLIAVGTDVTIVAVRSGRMIVRES